MSEPVLIYETLHGSRAYGTATADSDVDLRGVIVGPRAWYLGYRGGPEQIELSGDHVRFEIRKLLRLASASNPNILEILWTDASDHVVCTPAGQDLLAQRHLFLSRRVRHSFGGYAASQLKRIRTHRRWLLEPPEREPTRADFGLPEQHTVSRDQMGAAEALIEQGIDAPELTPEFVSVLQREKAYRNARHEWAQYERWKRERNPARAALEARFGYDTKHAMHLVRLLRMALEILETGEVRVRRPDADELLAIRAGTWTYDELVAYAEELEARLPEVARRSALPEQVDEEAIDALCVRIVEGVIRSR